MLATLNKIRTDLINIEKINKDAMFNISPSPLSLSLYVSNNYLTRIKRFVDVRTQKGKEVVEILTSTSLNDRAKLMALKSLFPNPPGVPRRRGNHRVRDIDSDLAIIGFPENYLDVGSSEGNITRSLATKLNLLPENVFATDISPQVPTSDYNFVLTDGFTLSFPSDNFDLVTMFMSGHHFTNPEVMLKEIYRVTKPGGHLLVREHDRSSFDDDKFYDLIHLFYEVIWGEEISIDQYLERPKSDKPNSLFFETNLKYLPKDEWIRLIESVGFKLIQSHGPAPDGEDRFNSFYALFQKEFIVLKITPLSLSYEAQLLPIVSNPYVMRNIGTGEVWSSDKLNQLISYSETDEKLNPFMRGYFYYVILLNQRVIGLVGLHHQNYDPSLKNRFFLTYFLSPEFQGKGWGTEAVRLAIASLRNKDKNPLIFSIYSDVLTTNIPAQRSMERLGFITVGNIRIRNIAYIRYILEIPDDLFFANLENMLPNVNYTKDEYINSVKTRKFPFPYKKYFYSNNIDTMFNNLKNYDVKTRLRESPYTIRNLNLNNTFSNSNRYIILLNEDADYLNFNILSDMFVEDLRMRCKLKFESKSPFNYFYDNYATIADILIRLRQQITPHNVREAIYREVKECTSFRPSNIVAMIQLFNAKSVLDFSSGWGDRLIGAISQDVEYIGIDPNSSLHPRYSLMIERLSTNPSKYIMIEGEAQTAVIPRRNYDLIMTSPPYFDLEQYTPETQGNSETDWFNNFLKIALDRSWSVLQSNGHMIININQYTQQQRYIYWMIEHMNSKSDAIYLGVISYSEANLRNPQPMFIWRKLQSQLQQPQFQQISQSQQPQLQQISQTQQQTQLQQQTQTQSRRLTTYIANNSNGGGNIKQYIQEALQKINITSEEQNTWDNVNLIWKPTTKGLEFDKLPNLQYLNNLETSEITLTTKVALFQSLNTVYGASSELIAPKISNNFPSNTLVIVKPPASFGGQGIYVDRFRNIPPTILSTQIVQRYIDNPLLWDGRKFDLRLYVLVTLTDIYRFVGGFARLAPQRYTTNNLACNIHITNTSIHGSEGFRELDEQHTPSISIISFLNSIKPLFQFAANKEIEFRRTNQRNFVPFELFGIDMMFDGNYKPWLIEINKNPSLNSSRPMFRNIIDGAISIVFNNKVPSYFIKI